MKPHKRTFQSLFILAIILLSASWIRPLPAQKEPYPPPKETPPLEDRQFDGTFIAWDKEENTTTEHWTWQSQAWEFGPYPNFAIFLLNGTEVTDKNFVPLGTPFKAVVSVQKTVFTGNSTLGRAGLNWNIELRTANGTETGHAHLRMVYVKRIETNYWNETDNWHVESFVFNQSEVTAIPGHPPPPPEEMKENSFYIFDKASSKVAETNDAWQIEFVGSFDETNTPIGPYWVDLEITDQYDSWIDYGFQAWEGKMSPNRMIAVGKPGVGFGWFMDSWTLEKLDMNNKPVYSVSKGVLWKIRINVTSAELENITIGLELAWGVKTFVNVTGWYSKAVVQKGGWMFNETSGTYYWNSTVEVPRTEQVFGPHLEERWVSVRHDREVNVTRQYWDPMTGEERFINEIFFANEKMFLIYDHSTGSFSVKQGCSYWGYDPQLRRDREFQVLYDLNTSDPTTRFYNLSLTESNWSQIGPDKYVIEFVGMFSNSTFTDRDEYWMEVNVFGKRGPLWADWSTGPSDFQIAVDKLVAVSTIIDQQGREVKGWMFQIDPSEYFLVQSKLYGAAVKYNDLDGVGVVFRTNTGSWSENESYWSEIEIRLVKDLATNELASVTYNRTERNIYVYGPHLGWELVNVTDWHMEYNSTSGTWEWVEGTYLTWNETIVTDWHWEHSRLNQTEYARDPNSPNIWMDTERQWVSDEDPAFRLPTSYATLNSANISLVDGVVTVVMNVTFLPNAPQSNYWWNMLFLNMTFDRDWSQGWGEHTVTEWTADQVYYINGSVTGGKAWYVPKPTTPLYTFYNGKKYLLEQLPYITINGVDLPIKARTQYDWWRQEEWKQYLFNEPYDPSLETEPRYYELLNGTKIYVKEAFQVMIRTIQLNTTDAYMLVGSNKVAIPNGTVFETYMPRAMEDWSKRYWDPTFGYEIVPYYYQLLNGTRIYRDEGFETQNYNMTTNRWDLFNKVYIESVTSLTVEYAGRGVTLNQTVVLLREPGDWQPLPDGSGYFLVMKNGTQITIKDPWAVPDEERWVTLNGKKYLVSWPDDYYTATYNGLSLLIHGGWDGSVFALYYTDLGIEGGTKYELPYPGAMAFSWWDLEGIESDGRKLRTFKSLTINGTKYVIYKDEQSGSFYIIVDGVRVSVTPPTIDRGYYYSQINGEDYWSVTQNGWVLQFGTYSEKAGQFSSTGPSLVTTTGYDPARREWNEHNRYGYDHENSTLYIQTPNGSRYDLHSEIYLFVWKVQIGNHQFYTMDAWDQWEQVYDNRTGELIHRSYVTALNGTKIYFNWDTNPPNWLEEIHIQIPGTNYTRLIPFNWQPLQVFDTLYVFNITIPALPWDATRTGVFYENGTEVPIGIGFKVFGTSKGPGTRYSYYGDENGTWIPTSIFVPGMKAPWNSSLDVQYFTTLDEKRIYSPYGFGWMGDRWGDPNMGELRQWDFINDDPVAGNRTASVIEGGYRVYLNDTIKVDVTTEWPEGWPDQYLIMKNGTSFIVHSLDDPEYNWITEIGNKTYLFRHVVTYYNLTDSEVIYNIADPIMADPYQVVTPTVYQAPLAVLDRQAWLWMNATTDSVLQDLTGYYLINASDQSRLDLELVSSWWNLSETARKTIFMDDLNDLYPRYNVTINGKEYYVIDPSPVIDRWDGEWSIENSMYRYPKVMDVTLDGTTYSIALFEQGGFWRNNLRWRRLETIKFENGTSYEVQEQFQWKPSFQVSINNQTVSINLEKMNIYKRHTVWGEVYRWMLRDMNVFTQREVNDIVVGIPEWGMWGIRNFDVVPETGAVDLDGDLNTTDDQYFVRRTHVGSDTENRTISRMWVEIIWDPNSSMRDDEMHIFAWMGKMHVSWTSEWSENYFWYYASNMSLVSSTVMQEINATIIDSETGVPNPGYWDIAYMVKNVTWEDLLEEAKKYDWDWITDQENEWKWIWFGTQQDYVTSWTQENGTQMAGIGVRYEFAGFSLYNGTEQTHFFMPRNIGNITFVTPGEAFGNTNASDSMVVPINATITFGVTYGDVNGTLFPFSEQRSMWGWWDRPIFGADFDVPNFMYRPTDSTIDKVSFALHFSANTATTDELNNNAVLKIDQEIGNWNLEPNVIDGRQKNSSGVMVHLMGNEVLQNRSLASNYYVTAFTGIAWDVTDERGSSVNNNNVTESSRFNIAAKLANASFATVKLGSTYDWGKPVTATDMVRTFNVTSKTAPLGAFKASFQSESGRSSTGFAISAMLYFLTVGFPKWDGYAVYNDPEVSFLLSKGVLIQERPFLPADQWWFWALIGSVAATVVVAVVFRKKIKSAFSRLRKPRKSVEHRDAKVETPAPTSKSKPEPSSSSLSNFLSIN